MKRVKLLRALELVKPGVSTKDVIEQANSFAFLENKIVSYNDEISISYPFEDIGFVGAVKAEELYLFLSKLKHEDIDIEITESELLLTAGKSKAGLKLQQNILLPLEELGKISAWEKLPDNFVDALTFTHAAASKDMAYPVLTCVHIREDGVIEASDNYKISRFTLGEKMPCSSFLLSAAIIKELINFEIVAIADSFGWKHFKTKDDVVFSARIFEGVFPNIDNIILGDKKAIFTFPKTFKESLERAVVFSKNEYTAEKEIKITISDKKIKIECASEYGWFEEYTNLRYTGESIAFLVHPDFLKEILLQITTCCVFENVIKFIGADWEHFIRLYEMEK